MVGDQQRQKVDDGKQEKLPENEQEMSRETVTIFGRGTILEPSTSHIGQGVALVAQTAAFVYIYVRISQIVERTLSFHATPSKAFSALTEEGYIASLNRTAIPFELLRSPPHPLTSQAKIGR